MFLDLRLFLHFCQQLSPRHLSDDNSSSNILISLNTCQSQADLGHSWGKMFLRHSPCFQGWCLVSNNVPSQKTLLLAQSPVTHQSHKPECGTFSNFSLGTFAYLGWTLSLLSISAWPEPLLSLRPDPCLQDLDYWYVQMFLAISENVPSLNFIHIHCDFCHLREMSHLSH